MNKKYIAKSCFRGLSSLIWMNRALQSDIVNAFSKFLWVNYLWGTGSSWNNIRIWRCWRHLITFVSSVVTTVIALVNVKRYFWTSQQFKINLFGEMNMQSLVFPLKYVSFKVIAPVSAYCKRQMLWIMK